MAQFILDVFNVWLWKSTVMKRLMKRLVGSSRQRSVVTKHNDLCCSAVCFWAG